MSEKMILYTAFYVLSMLSIGLLMTIREFYRLGGADTQTVNKSGYTEANTGSVTSNLVPGYSGA